MFRVQSLRMVALIVRLRQAGTGQGSSPEPGAASPTSPEQAATTIHGSGEVIESVRLNLINNKIKD